VKKLLIATSNKNKIREISAMLDDRNLLLQSLADFENFPDVIEDRDSFAGNARKKANEYFKHCQIPVIADDSGLVVDKLNGEPGVYSARYAGENSTDLENNKRLLNKIKIAKLKEPKAKFVAVICYKDSEREAIFIGEVEGVILSESRGKRGFGYDPLFYLPESQKTFAEMDLIEKAKYSHRAKAIKKLQVFLNKI
jgi:XTP/dITP diphosphohydrolase